MSSKSCCGFLLRMSALGRPSPSMLCAAMAQREGPDQWPLAPVHYRPPDTNNAALRRRGFNAGSPSGRGFMKTSGTLFAVARARTVALAELCLRSPQLSQQRHRHFGIARRQLCPTLPRNVTRTPPSTRPAH